MYTLAILFMDTPTTRADPKHSSGRDHDHCSGRSISSSRNTNARNGDNSANNSTIWGAAVKVLVVTLEASALVHIVVSLE